MISALDILSSNAAAQRHADKVRFLVRGRVREGDSGSGSGDPNPNDPNSNPNPDKAGDGERIPLAPWTDSR